MNLHAHAHFFAFLAHNTKVYGHEKAKWRKAPPYQGKDPRRIGKPPLSFTEYRRENSACWVWCGKGQSHKHDDKRCKVYKGDKQACFPVHPEKVPKGKRTTNGNRDKLVEVDTWDQATGAIGGFGKLMTLPSR